MYRILICLLLHSKLCVLFDIFCFLFLIYKLREFDTNSKGISFLLAANTRWIYDESPIDGIKYEETLKELKSIIENSKSKVFKSFIQEYLLNNMHRVTIELYPSAFMETNMIEVRCICTKIIITYLSQI